MKPTNEELRAASLDRMLQPLAADIEELRGEIGSTRRGRVGLWLADRCVQLAAMARSAARWITG